MYLIPIDEIKLRQERLFSKISQDNSVAILFSPQIMYRTNDVGYRYRPDSDVVYFTGFEEPNLKIMFVCSDEERKVICFVPEANQERDFWIGKIDQDKLKSLSDEILTLDKFDEILEEKIKISKRIFYPIGKDENMDLKIAKSINSMRKMSRDGVSFPKIISDIRDITSEMRAVKSEAELSLIRKAVDIEKEALEEARKEIKAGKFEYEIEARLISVYRKYGAVESFVPIVASGDNAAVIHYTKNERIINEDDLVVIDSGAEYSYYASDVTRTFAVSKAKLKKEKKLIYEAVVHMQNEIISLVKPGITFEILESKMVELVTDYLREFGILKYPKQQIIEEKKFKDFYPHKIGHFLGVDVHDTSLYLINGKPKKLEPSMVITIEPGIYILKDKDVPEDFKGIGVRIEDDILLTQNGCEVLTKDIPKLL